MSRTSPSPAEPHLRFLRTVRAYELQLALTHFPPPGSGDDRRRVLEIGAGTGLQAQAIQDAGYRVLAIDLPSSRYRNERVFDVVDYDGRTIPVGDRDIDIVFSSNVLEHIGAIDAYLDETGRVLADDGIAIHLLPSSACRFWSIPGHYIWLVKRLFARARPQSTPAAGIAASDRPRTPGSYREWFATLFPTRHGERGTTATELFYYSRYWWKKKFRAHGFTVVKAEKTRLFYTMSNAFADAIGIPARERMSSVFGSACNLYVLKHDARSGRRARMPEGASP